MNRKTDEECRVALQKIADIVHCGGLMGFEDVNNVLTEVRKISLPYWNTSECDKRQRQKIN